MRLKPGNVAALKEYAPAIGSKQARNKIEKRGLTRTVRADDGMRTTAGNAQIEFVDRGQAAKFLVKFSVRSVGSVMVRSVRLYWWMQLRCARASS